MLLSNQKEAAAPEVAAPVIWPGILPGIIDTRYRCHCTFAAIRLKEAAAPEVAAPVIWPGILPGIIDARYRCHRVYAAIHSKGGRACPARLYHTGMAAS